MKKLKSVSFLMLMMGLTQTEIAYCSSSFESFSGGLEPGVYTIKMKALSSSDKNVGMLSWSHFGSSSGYYAQVLAERGCYPDERGAYKEGGHYRDHILWEISKARRGSYLIRTRGLSSSDENVGMLSWSHFGSSSGYYAQVLAERGCYPDERGAYKEGGHYRDHILWEFERILDKHERELIAAREEALARSRREEEIRQRELMAAREEALAKLRRDQELRSLYHRLISEDRYFEAWKLEISRKETIESAQKKLCELAKISVSSRAASESESLSYIGRALLIISSFPGDNPHREELRGIFEDSMCLATPPAVPVAAALEAHRSVVARLLEE